MSIIRDIIEVNREVGKKTLYAVSKSPLLILVTAGVLVVNVMIAYVAGLFGFLAGLFLLLADGAILGVYLYTLEQVVRYKRLTTTDVKNGLSVYFRRTVIVIMIVNLGMYALSVLADVLGGIGLPLILAGTLAAFVFLNPLPEMIYLRHYTEGESITKSFEFIVENWLDWFVPLTPMMILAFGGGFLGNMWLPGVGMASGILLQAVVLPFLMVYRGYLFDLLSKSSRRKRQFRRNLH